MHAVLSSLGDGLLAAEVAQLPTVSETARHRYDAMKHVNNAVQEVVSEELALGRYASLIFLLLSPLFALFYEDFHVVFLIVSVLQVSGFVASRM